MTRAAASVGRLRRSCDEGWILKLRKELGGVQGEAMARDVIHNGAVACPYRFTTVFPADHRIKAMAVRRAGSRCRRRISLGSNAVNVDGLISAKRRRLDWRWR